MSSEPASGHPPRPTKKKNSPWHYLLIVIIIILVVAAARYQEELSGMYRLHAWDRGAPGRAVVEFLTAGKKGEQAQAGNYLGSPLYAPLIKDGTWLGYSTSVQDTTILYLFDELIPSTEIKPISTEFNYVGSGSADVTVPDKKGNPVTYSLVRADSGWKIINIRGGRAELSSKQG